MAMLRFGTMAMGLVAARLCSCGYAYARMCLFLFRVRLELGLEFRDSTSASG